MEEVQESRYECKFCSKKFPCGRSLGGHMRSHLTNCTPETAEKKPRTKLMIKAEISSSSSCFEAGYGLRENPRKTCRFTATGSSEEASRFDTLLDKLCKKSLVSDSQSDNEAAKLPSRKRKRRRSERRARCLGNSISSSSFSISETEQDREEVAMCLIMLSRDVNHWNRGLKSADNFSKNLESENCSSGFGKSRSINGRLEKEPIKRKLYTGNDEHELELGSNSKKLLISGDSDLDLIKKSQKRSRFECTTCDKTFHSYQALGGHRASHKKTRGCFASNTEISEENSLETDDHIKLVNHYDNDSKPEKQAEKSSRFSTKKTSHECPICFKVFSSGQALGGHKRSHVINGSDHSKQIKTAEINKPVPEIRDFLDLNLPAPDEQDNNGVFASVKPWWVESSHKREALVGLISN